MFGTTLSLSETILITEKRDLELRCERHLDAIEIKNKQIAILHKIKNDIKAAHFVLFTDRESIIAEICPAVKTELIREQIEIRSAQKEELYKKAYAELDSEAYAFFLQKAEYL